MIQDVGNIELFELLETDSKTQCKAGLSYWSEGIVCCTCGHLLKETVANRSFIVFSLDLLSIPEYVIKKGRLHGHRYGKLPEDKEYHLVHNLKKRCIKRKFKGIHDRFLRDHVFRERMIENNRDEDVCRAWDVLAEQDHTYRLSESEYFHYRQNWRSLSLSWWTSEKTFWLKPSVVYVKPFTPRRWRTTTQADALLEIQTMETGIEFFLHLVAMERILVVFLRIQRKSIKRMQAKVCDRTEQPVF